ncbi:MAG TPA: hypothetical protein VER32_05895 [Pyrinomonadaceae bacterium]|nr:hypothetical protein [Pyrinomonadaceae bacterium]
MTNGNDSARRRGERGAAMLTAMLTSMLLLVGGGALLVTTTMSATSAIDSTAETQAYYAAESGIQAALNVLRGNVQPNPLPAAAGSQLNSISFRRALYLRTPNDVTVPSSNLPTDNSTQARLSRWLPYSADFPDRVTISPNYNLLTGTAYNVSITDPDLSDQIRFTTSGQFSAPNLGAAATVTVQNNPARLIVEVGGARLSIRYNPRADTPLTAHPPAASDLGTITIAEAIGNVNITDLFGTNLPRFRVAVSQTEPWTSTAFLEGQLDGELVAAANGAITLNTLRITFNSPSSLATNGAVYALPASLVNLAYPTTTLTSTVTADDPRRLFVNATGFGPRGAVKNLKLLVTNNALNVRPPATITVAGCPITDFSVGDSNATDYSGLDNSGLAAPRPVFGVDCPASQTAVANSIAGSNPDVHGTPTGIMGAEVPKPEFLESADAARQFLLRAEQIARGQGRFFTSKPADLGTDAAPKFTFIDNAGGAAVDLGPHLQGVGMLIVTGKLSTSGNTSFKGIILVLGEGVVERQGGGNGEMLGAIIVAKFPRPGPGGFESATFNFGGGGTSNTQFDQNEVNRALGTVGMGILGLAEY